jgi:hypothetical protein
VALGGQIRSLTGLDRERLLGQGFLPYAPVDEVADCAEQQIRHPDHEIDAVVVSTGQAGLVVFLRTGGIGHGGLSGWARVRPARQAE